MQHRPVRITPVVTTAQEACCQEEGIRFWARREGSVDGGQGEGH